MIKPLEVFALNEQMARETGSIPYRSLRWVRRYHECGEFEIVVPANIYSPTWAYIYAYGRPETGIIQKVEFSDSSTVYGGIDSVTLSGFFLECILNRITFLVEQPETQTIIHYMDKPKRPFYKKSQQPTVYQDPTGEYYITDGTGKVVSTEDGRTVNTNGLTEVHYNAAFGKDPDGDGDMECVYNYYTNSDKTQITAVNALGYKNTYDVVFTAPNGDVFYRGNTGTLTQAVGTVDTVGQTYFSKRRAYDAKNGIEYVETVQVQGPWQRTGATDPITSGDSVELVYKWIRQMLGDWILYADTDVKGVQKTIDPTFQLLGDLAYSTLQEVEASFRIEYGFENDSYLLTIWRGADRSQEESSTEEPVSSKAAPEIYAMSPVARTMAAASMPTGYHMIEYVETSGTQWIDTGYRPDQDTHMSMDAEILDVSQSSLTGIMFGSQTAVYSPGYECFAFNQDYSMVYWSQHQQTTTKAAKVGDMVHADFDGENVLLSANGTVLLNHKDNRVAFTSGSSLNIGRLTRDGYVGKIRIYSFGMWQGEQEVMRLIPCMNDSGVAGMLDTTSGTFHASDGSGSFIAGPRIAEPVDVPDGFDELQYIESSGTQYIDTGVSNSFGFQCSMEVEMGSTSGYQFLAGTMVQQGSTYYRSYLMVYEGKFGLGVMEHDDYTGTASTGSTYEIEFSTESGQSYLNVGGSKVDECSIPYIAPAENILVLGINGAGSYFASARLHSCEIRTSGIVRRILVPVVRKSDNAVGMFDKVSGQFFGNAGTGEFVAGPKVEPPTVQLIYSANIDVYSGQTPPTTGKVGEMVEVAECGFASDGHVFTEWSTTPEGAGTSYAPGELYELTEGGGVLYARWSGGGEPPEPEPEPEPEPGPSPSVKKPWAVFSDTWGTISGYTATRDESAYKNTCYVLYDYDEPESFDDDGKPVYTSSKTIGNTITSVTSISVSIPYKRNRGFFTERVGDEDEPAIETYLDLRDEKPTCDNQWSREPQTEEYDEPITQEEANQKIEELAKKLYSTDEEGYTTDMKSVYEAFEQGLHGRGTQMLNEQYPVLTNLDTGTVNTDGYLKDWDLGDRVDFGVSTVGLRETGRIIEVEEVYESNGGSVDHSIHIEIGDSLLTRMKVK